MGGSDEVGVVSDLGDEPEIYYYPADDKLNYWMFAMIGIGCVFIAFVGFSLYIMCRDKSRSAPG